MPPDAARLIDYAARRGMLWAWRYRRIGTEWIAQVELCHVSGGATPYWLGRGQNPQGAVDHAIGLAIGYWEATGNTHIGISHGGTDQIHRPTVGQPFLQHAQSGATVIS